MRLVPVNRGDGKPHQLPYVQYQMFTVFTCTLIHVALCQGDPVLLLWPRSVFLWFQSEDLDFWLSTTPPPATAPSLSMVRALGAGALC